LYDGIQGYRNKDKKRKILSLLIIGKIDKVVHIFSFSANGLPVPVNRKKRII